MTDKISQALENQANAYSRINNLTDTDRGTLAKAFIDGAEWLFNKLYTASPSPSEDLSSVPPAESGQYPHNLEGMTIFNAHACDSCPCETYYCMKLHLIGGASICVRKLQEQQQ